MQVEDIQPGLLNNPSMADIYSPDSFLNRYEAVANYKGVPDLKIPSFSDMFKSVVTEINNDLIKNAPIAATADEINKSIEQDTPNFFKNNFQI